MPERGKGLKTNEGARVPVVHARDIGWRCVCEFLKVAISGRGRFRREWEKLPRTVTRALAHKLEQR